MLKLISYNLFKNAILKAEFILKKYFNKITYHEGMALHF
jgi:hypothetical protein